MGEEVAEKCQALPPTVTAPRGVLRTQTARGWLGGEDAPDRCSHRQWRLGRPLWRAGAREHSEGLSGNTTPAAGSMGRQHARPGIPSLIGRRREQALRKHFPPPLSGWAAEAGGPQSRRGAPWGGGRSDCGCTGPGRTQWGTALCRSRWGRAPAGPRGWCPGPGGERPGPLLAALLPAGRGHPSLSADPTSATSEESRLPRVQRQQGAHRAHGSGKIPRAVGLPCARVTQARTETPASAREESS